MRALLSQIDRLLETIFNNIYASTAIILFLVLYAGLAAPNLPPFLAALFENPLFKFLILFLVLIIRNYDPTVALLSVIGFVLSMQALNRHRMFNMAMDLGNLLPGDGYDNKVSGCPRRVNTCQLGGGHEGEYDAEAGDCATPQPQDYDPVLPPQPEVPEQVAAVNTPNCQYQGPQGMQYPSGFPGMVHGAEYGTPESEL